MKQLATLLTLCSIGLFAVGCTEPAPGPEPTPSDSTTVEGGSAAVEEGDASATDAPPATEEAPPSLPAPESAETPATN